MGHSSLPMIITPPFLFFAQAGSGAIAKDYLMSAKVAKAISPSVT
jgi:hypothetical protein